MARTLVHVLRAAGLGVLALVLSHELAFLVRYGSIYGEALVHAGHGQAWSDAVVVVVVGSGVSLAAALMGLRRLGLRLRHRAVGRAPEPTAQVLIRRWLRDWALLAISVTVALTVQENLEHAASGLPVPGPAILVSEQYPYAMAIVVAVSFVVSLIGSLLAWRHAVLLARLRALHAAWPRPRYDASAPAALSRFILRASVAARRRGRRAPPIAQPA